MAKAQIDVKKLHAQLRSLSRDELLDLLEQAIDLLPKNRLSQLVEGTLDLDELRPDPPSSGNLLEAVVRFHEASLRGDYYEDFNVNSKNFMDLSRGTEKWIAECNRLLDRCVEVTQSGASREVREAFEKIFELLELIDEGGDEVVFFADEAGSWQVGVDWDKVIPAWLKTLANTADAEEFAQEAVRIIDEFERHDRDRHLKEALKVGNAAQKKALEEANVPSKDRRQKVSPGASQPALPTQTTSQQTLLASKGTPAEGQSSPKKTSRTRGRRS